MGKQTFGGDDDTEYAGEQQKKLKLSKFELSPDYNIRDLFWKILASYAATKTPGVDLKGIGNQRTALAKVALSVLETRESDFYGLSPQFVARYTLMMTIDGGWEDAFMKLIEDAKESRRDAWQYVVQAMKHLLKSDRYRQGLWGYMKTAIRNSNAYPYVLFYLPKIKDGKLIEELKKEISIFARGDVDENQLNAMEALALLKDDAEAEKLLLNLLNHWDVKIRRKAAELLKDAKMDEETHAFLVKRLEAEPDAEIKKMLKRKVSPWKRK